MKLLVKFKSGFRYTITDLNSTRTSPKQTICGCDVLGDKDCECEEGWNMVDSSETTSISPWHILDASGGMFASVCFKSHVSALKYLNQNETTEMESCDVQER